MSRGAVIDWNDEHHFGFVRRNDGRGDIMVHGAWLVPLSRRHRMQSGPVSR